jgi:hypothetical protein
MSSLAREGANAADRLASRLDRGGVEAVVADVRAWGRRNPGTFLLGAATLGFVTGRIVRNMSPNGGNGTSAANGSTRDASRQLSSNVSPGLNPSQALPPRRTFEDDIDEGPAL